MQKYRLTYQLQNGSRPGIYELVHHMLFDDYLEARNFILGLMGSEDDRPLERLKLEPYPIKKEVK